MGCYLQAQDVIGLLTLPDCCFVFSRKGAHELKFAPDENVTFLDEVLKTSTRTPRAPPSQPVITMTQ